MGRTYLADKETLDNVNAKVGSNGDSNTTSLFGKLNALLTSWTSARAAKVDTIATDASSAKTNASQAVTNTATNNTSSATGILSQKLSYLIDRVNALEASAGGQKILVRGPVIETIVPHQSGVWQTAIDIKGAGVVHSVYNDSVFTYTSQTKVYIDDEVFVLGKPNSESLNNIIQANSGSILYSSYDSLASSVPIKFKKLFKVEILPTNAYGTDHKIRAFCEVYRDLDGGS